jgi:ABC-2 type transport system ATP-binding protein
MTAAISVSGLTRRYRGQLTLDRVSVDIEAGSVTGLLGRNGAGKTTLMRIIAGQEFASAGTVRILGVSPGGNDRLPGRMVFIREDQVYPDVRTGDALRAASWFYPGWSGELAGSLMADFALPWNRAIKKLSRGMKSALGIVIGLAARAEVTLFDEPYAGLDAVASQLFYDRLLADYAEHPRTVLLSTHQVGEAAGLLERVVVMDRGRIVLDAAADDLRGAAARVSGPVLAVEEFAARHQVWDRRRMGSQESAVVAGPLGDADRAPATISRLTVEPLSLQELVRYAAGRPAPETPDGQKPETPDGQKPETPDGQKPAAPDGQKPAAPGSRTPEVRWRTIA